MLFENTEHLSKLPLDSIKEVHQKWPNPAIIAVVPIALCVGPAYYLMNIEEGKNFAELVGVFAAWITLLFAFFIYTFVKLSKARKLLKQHAEQHSVPFKAVLKEFKKNLPKIGKALKKTD